MRELYLSVILLILVVEGKVFYNSQIQHPNNLQFADLTGDSVDEFYSFLETRVVITTTEKNVTSLGFIALPEDAKRIISGKFTGGPKEILCAQFLTLSKINCYAVSGNELVPEPIIISQTSDFIGDDDVIVGDYDGNGFDDILLYKPTDGAFTMYTYVAGSGQFQLANWEPGQLGDVNHANKRIRSGDFLEDDGFTDLLVYDPTTGCFWVYIAIFDTKYNFILWFESPSDRWMPNFEIQVAELDGDGASDIALQSTIDGHYEFFIVNGEPYYMSNIEVAGYWEKGQIFLGPNSKAYFAKLKSLLSGEDSGQSDKRDDCMVYSEVDKKWRRADARFTGVKTYVSVYEQLALILADDQDGDCITTLDELGGYDWDYVSSNWVLLGRSNGILPSYGACPFIKDIFVQVDHMQGPPSETWNYEMLPAARDLAKSTMAEYNIKLHIFPENEVPYKPNLGDPVTGTFNWGLHFDYHNTYLSVGRKPFFHYCLFARQYNNDIGTGESYATPSHIFLVTLMVQGTVNEQVGTFLHELGHNMGLPHGSVDDLNFKPNHLSIMNYNYQFDGVHKNGVRKFIYSDIDCLQLVESSLIESNGVTCSVGSNTYLTLVKSLSAQKALNFQIDWDGNTFIDPIAVSVDINTEGGLTPLPGGRNEYDHMYYCGVKDNNRKRKAPSRQVNRSVTRY